MNINKKGILATNEIFESDGANLVQSDTITSIYSYTPSTSTNSCISGWVVDYSTTVSGEKVYYTVDVSWKNFDTSNTSGTFSIWFQGSQYDVTSSSWGWTASNPVCGSLNNTYSLTNLVLSSTLGTTTLVGSVTIPSNYPSPYSKAYVGVRSDYSNGSGTITLRNLRVIREKYYSHYINSTSSPMLHIGKNYVSTESLYEF